MKTPKNRQELEATAKKRMADLKTQQHTPGPWKAGTGWVMGPANQAEPPICYKDSTAGSLAEDEANLRLIAAAPEMLEALYAAVYVMKDYRVAEYALLEAVIAKAEGK